MRGWIVALFAAAIGSSLMLAACGGASSGRPGTPVPPGWNTHASGEGMTLVIPPGSGPVSGAVEFQGTISPDLRSRGGKVTIQLWPEGSFRSLGSAGQSNYKGDASPAAITVDIRSDGTFGDLMKLPRVIQVGQELRLVEPGPHYLALVLDDKHAVYAPFEIAQWPVLPTPSLAPYLSLGSFQFLDSQTGWLSASSCRDQPRGAEDEYGNVPTQPPPACEPALYATADGGQTWSLLSHEAVDVFRFEAPQFGLSIRSNQYCPQSPCASSVLRSTDGGRHWVNVYESLDRLSELSIIDGEARVVGDSCGYQDRNPSCTHHFLKSVDEGLTWIQSDLPASVGLGAGLSRATKHDAFMASDNGREAGQLVSTHDGGATWASAPLPASLFEGGAVFFLSPLEGWLLVGGEPGAGNQWKWLYATKDGGVSWTKVAESQLKTPEPALGDLGTAGYVNLVLFTSERDGWLALSRRGLIHSTDGGLHWTYVNVDQGEGEVRPFVQFTDPLHGWAMSDYYLEQPPILQLEQALWSTSDGGATWQRLPLPAPQSP